jgi:hypothetical protein
MSGLREIVSPRLMDALTPSFYPSTVTIKPPVEVTDEYGEPDTTWPTPLSADYTDIPCAIAAAGSMERRTTTNTYAESTHTIALTGYYPLVRTAHRATDDAGVDYDILGVEHDSLRTVTTLVCRIVSV